MSKSVILVTGASSGFGLMTSRALAQAGHTVYASMLDTAGRNAPRVAEAAGWAAEHGTDLRTVELDVLSDASAEVARAIVRLVDAPFGKRPFRVHIDPSQDGAEIVNGVADHVRREMFRNVGLADLLFPRTNG